MLTNLMKFSDTFSILRAAIAGYNQILEAIAKIPTIWGLDQLMTVTTAKTDKPNSYI